MSFAVCQITNVSLHNNINNYQLFRCVDCIFTFVSQDIVSVWNNIQTLHYPIYIYIYMLDAKCVNSKFAQYITISTFCMLQIMIMSKFMV